METRDELLAELLAYLLADCRYYENTDSPRGAAARELVAKIQAWQAGVNAGKEE